ncbi:MAG: helix-turn-helix domain-containing protein [Clostridiales bacterium]|nr:helix-turn-helix domain-containing protein [Clostridiales bacterium]
MGKLINLSYKTFTIIPNSVLKDPNLGMKERGLLTTLLGLPDGWDFSINGLSAILKDGRESLRSTLSVLEDIGYVERIPVKNEKGKFDGCDYKINIPPITNFSS